MGNVFYFENIAQPQQLLAPDKAWFQIYDSVYSLYSGRIRGTSLFEHIAKAIQERVSYPTPLSENAMRECCEEVYINISWHQQRQAVHLLTLYNIRPEGYEASSIRMPLANSILHLDGSSILAGDVLTERDEAEIEELKNSCILEISVKGDLESRKVQADCEAEQANKVLRYVTRWTITRGKTPAWRNPAKYVSLVKSQVRSVAHFYPAAENRVLYLGHCAHDGMSFGKDSLKYAQRFCGLDDINYHFANSGHPISNQIIRALTAFDSGVRSSTFWEAIHNYVVSVNVAVLTAKDNAKRLREDVETLIRHGKGYVRSDFLASEGSVPVIETWEDLVKATAKPFERFYRLRSTITHGGEYKYGGISETAVMEVRVLAHNVIRLAAKLAREKQWKDHDEAKDWFEAKRRQAKNAT